jgi:hypothetical protein
MEFFLTEKGSILEDHQFHRIIPLLPLLASRKMQQSLSYNSVHNIKKTIKTMHIANGIIVA